jgi:hypothetical protein
MTVADRSTAQKLEGAMTKASRTFRHRWIKGFSFLAGTTFVCGFCLALGGVFAGASYAMLVLLPAEIFWHSSSLEDYIGYVVLFGCLVWGVAMIGDYDGKAVTRALHFDDDEQRATNTRYRKTGGTL